MSARFLCKLVHPELQITDNLAKQRLGIIFSYHPEFYERTSRTYGPGFVALWFLLQASAFIKLFTQPSSQVNLDADIAGILAFVFFAGTDLTLKSIAILDKPQRSWAYSCIRTTYGVQNPRLLKDYVQIDLRDPISSDDLALGQDILSLIGPTSICTLFFLFAICFWIQVDSLTISFSPNLRRALFATAGYASICLTVFYGVMGLDSCSAAIQIWVAEVVVGAGYTFVAILIWCLCLWYMLVAIPMIVNRTSPWVGNYWGCENPKVVEKTWRNVDYPKLGLYMLVHGGILVFINFFPRMVNWAFESIGATMTPDVGVEFLEKDQATAAVLGFVHLLYTVLWTVEDAPALVKKDEKIQSREQEGIIQQEQVEPKSTPL